MEVGSLCPQPLIRVPGLCPVVVVVDSLPGTVNNSVVILVTITVRPGGRHEDRQEPGLSAHAIPMVELRKQKLRFAGTT